MCTLIIHLHLQICNDDIPNIVNKKDEKKQKKLGKINIAIPMKFV